MFFRLFYPLLFLKFGFCTEEFKFEVKTVTTGQNVTLTCPRQTSAHYRENLYWIRLVSGNLPEFLGVLFNFMDVSQIPRIQTKQNPEQFILHINEAQQNDTGLYYCIKVRQLEIIFINGTFVKIKGEESDVNVVLQRHPSATVHPENPDTLQCSVLSNSEWLTCPADNRVYWFRAGSDNSHPNLLYLQGMSQAECERSPEVATAQTCFYNFSEISDAGTYYCAVAACGQILFGNGAKLKAANVEDFSKIVLPSLISALGISLAVISYLIYKIKKKTCGCCKDHVLGIGDNKSQQKEEDTLVYSAPKFNMNKAKKAKRGNLKPAQEEMVYADVKTV